jgi:Putative beta-barrel porin-2, OmpL-like. bbp2
MWRRLHRDHVAAKCAVLLTVCACRATSALAQSSVAQSASAAVAPAAVAEVTPESAQQMQARITRLEAEVAELRAMIKSQLVTTKAAAPNGAAPAVSAATLSAAAVPPGIQAPPPAPATTPPSETQSALQTADRKVLDFLQGTTLNVALDTYYAYNFNDPVGRVNLLRAYDVLSNEISLNQADIVLERAPDVSAGRRWGGRLDLQFGQATDTLQGNPSNEPRPEVYRNIFQAYGTYIFPVGKGLTLDVGKWSSSLGIEGNYTKDQINYSRAYWFNFLPFYHMGARVTLPVNDRFTFNYWIVNGTNQVEATNGYKDELFGFTAKPTKKVTWTFNYYIGQEHPDRALAVTPSNPIPVQPGLNFVAINPAPDGKTHIFDSYVSWQATNKLTVAFEGDYFISRLWRDQAPGHSAAPSHVDGGAAYLRYQLLPKLAIGTRAEYLSDRGGLFSGITQALKENTVTLDYALNDGFLMRYEWRRDYSNQPSFLTSVQGVLAKEQNTATVGLIWWWGRKEGAW